MECSDAALGCAATGDCYATPDCFGVTLGYQGAGTSSPYVDQFITMYQLSSGASPVTSETDFATGTIAGKQRGIFGAYSVYNNALDQLSFYKLTTSGLALTKAITVEAAVQYLGSHEYYWWGWGSKFLAKLSDGVSFKFLRVADDFDTIAA